MPDQALAHRYLDRAPLVARVAGRRHGLVTTAQLLTAGYDKAAITRAVASTRLHRVYRGVYAVGHRGLSREGLWMAGVLAAGIGAVLSHLCAAALWELLKLRTDFVTVIAPKARRPTGPLRVYECRNLDPRDVTICHGIPVTTVARLLVDLTDLKTPHELANVIYEADHWGRFDATATWEAMGRANDRPNLRVLEQALALNAAGSSGTRSERDRSGRAEPPAVEGLPGLALGERYLGGAPPARGH